MSASIDNDPAEESEDARGVLASWLDDYSSGRCDRADMQESFLSVCRGNPDAPWDALALLDQYQRRGRIDATLARSLKTDIAQLVFGVANQTEASRDNTDAAIDTTGSRWRKLLEERDPDSINTGAINTGAIDTGTIDPEETFGDPTLFRRDFDPPTTRPPPAIRLDPPVVRERERFPEVPAASRPAQQRPPQPKAPQSPDVLRNRYELLSVLGRGSSGTVYKALDGHRAHLSRSAQSVAVKVLKLDYRDRPEALAELEREFHLAQSLSHPNIVSIFDLDRDGATYFIVMELLEGELLGNIMRRLDGRPMARDHAFAIISSIGAALAHAHRRDIVHADLKPGNVMITNGGEVRVLDFGFARDHSLGLHSASSMLDETSAPAPAYASVERVNGSEPHPSDDVYSLACIAYELLSGRHPFGGRSALLARAHGRHPRRISGLSRRQSQALHRALLWTRGERKMDVADFLAALGCAEASNRLVSPDELVAPGTGGSKRLRNVALSAFLIAAIAAGVFSLSRIEIPRPTSDAAPVAPPAADREAQVMEAPAAAPAQQNEQNATSTAAAATVEETDSAAAQAETPASTAPAPATSSSPASTAPLEPATIEFDKDTYVATESDGAVQLLVTRAGSVRQALRFRWTLRENSAKAGADFAAICPCTEQMPAGARSATLTVPLVSDAIAENTELFLVEIESLQEGVRLGERSSAAVIIVDDD